MRRNLWLSMALMLLAASLLLLGAAGCGPNDGDDAARMEKTPTPTRPAPPQGKCGDGICDDVERKNPQLCPEDCPPQTTDTPTPTPSAGPTGTDTPTPTSTPTATPTGTGTGTPSPTPSIGPDDGKPPGGSAPDEPEDAPTPTNTPSPTPTPTGTPSPEPDCDWREWWLEIEGCGLMRGTEPSVDVCEKAAGCIAVDEQCDIAGMLWGAYDTCNFESPTGDCTWEGECPDFELPVSGRALTGTLTINLHPNQVLEHATGNCLGVAVYFDPGIVLQSAFASAIRNNAGYFGIIEAEHGALTEVDGSDMVIGQQLTYYFDMRLADACR